MPVQAKRAIFRVLSKEDDEETGRLHNLHPIHNTSKVAHPEDRGVMEQEKMSDALLHGN